MMDKMITGTEMAKALRELADKLDRLQELKFNATRGHVVFTENGAVAEVPPQEGSKVYAGTNIIQ
jgi:hypothetical protein